MPDAPGDDFTYAKGLVLHGTPVRAARNAAGLTVNELAAKSSVPADRIKSFEIRRARPNRSEIKRLSAALGLSVNFFLK